jgi:hypothetical protein
VSDPEQLKQKEVPLQTLSLQTSVADLSTTAILAACGIEAGATKGGQFDAYLTMSSALGDFHVHIHACATRVTDTPAPAVRH